MLLISEQKKLPKNDNKNNVRISIFLIRKVWGWEAKCGSRDWCIICQKLAAVTFWLTSMAWEGQKKQVACCTFCCCRTSILDWRQASCGGIWPRWMAATSSTNEHVEVRLQRIYSKNTSVTEKESWIWTVFFLLVKLYLYILSYWWYGLSSWYMCCIFFHGKKTESSLAISLGRNWESWIQIMTALLGFTTGRY